MEIEVENLGFCSGSAAIPSLYLHLLLELALLLDESEIELARSFEILGYPYAELVEESVSLF